MKKLKKYHFTICFSIICIVFATTLFTVPAAKADRTKKIENRIPVKPDQGVVLASFQNSDLIIKYHDKPEIVYSLTVTIKSNDEDDENEFIDSIYVKDKVSAKEVMVQMVDHAPPNEHSDVNIFGLHFGDEFKKNGEGRSIYSLLRMGKYWFKVL